MAEDWSTRQKCLDRMINRYNAARTMQTNASGHITSFCNTYGTETDPITRGIFGYACQAFQDISMCLRYLINYDAGNDPTTNVPYYCVHYTIGGDEAEFELTWQQIIAAWDAADLVGWGRTILAIDEMRMTIFPKPLATFGPLPIFQ